MSRLSCCRVYKTQAAALVLGLLASGCAAGAPPPGVPATEEESASDESAAISRFPNRISRDEIMTRSSEHNAMGLIRRLRPAWLRSRGSNSFNSPGAMYPTVYVDNMRREGGLSALFQVPTSEIRMMEFIGPADATTRWGTGHSAGVIRIVTGR